MAFTEFSYESSGGVVVAASRWDPPGGSGSARGIVQLTHGMGEHIARYDQFASYLAARGFLVLGQDHRGHGRTGGEPDRQGHLGDDGWDALVADIGRLSAIARDAAPGVPLVLFGHSMGSFAAQQYVLEHSADIDALALTGTAAIDLLEPALDLDAAIDLSMFNTAFAPARTEYDWLSRDEAQVDKYVADPWCGFGLDSTAGKQMFAGARAVADEQRLARMRRDLPVYIAVGELDPINANLTVVQPLVERYHAVFADVEFTVYPGARHEILNETNRDEVYAGLLGWLDRVVPCLSSTVSSSPAASSTQASTSSIARSAP